MMHLSFIEERVKQGLAGYCERNGKANPNTPSGTNTDTSMFIFEEYVIAARKV